MSQQEAGAAGIQGSHLARQMAESFGTNAERYDRTRPRYPEEMIERLLAASPGHEVLDVGAGTGISTRQFTAAGADTLGVEVDPRMAEFARAKGARVEVGKFEDWDPQGRTFDLVIAGQTWHWIDPVAGAAKAAAVLRPGGRLAVFWNAMEPPEELAETFAEVNRRGMPAGFTPPKLSAADGYALMVAKAADGLGEAGGFGEMETWRFEWDHAYTRDEWLDQLPTTGTMTRLTPEQLAPVLAEVGAAIDAVGGSFTAHYTTVVGTATRSA